MVHFCWATSTPSKKSMIRSATKPVIARLLVQVGERMTACLRDAGVFQIGIGLMMLCTLPYRDLSAVVLAGFVFTNTFHAITHALDRHIGGNDSDWWMLALGSVLAGAALVVRF